MGLLSNKAQSTPAARDPIDGFLDEVVRNPDSFFRNPSIPEPIKRIAKRDPMAMFQVISQKNPQVIQKIVDRMNGDPSFAAGFKTFVGKLKQSETGTAMTQSEAPTTTESASSDSQVEKYW